MDNLSPFALARRDLNLSQEHVARTCGASQRAVSELDQGTVPRSVILAAKAGHAVGLTLDQMFPDAAALPLVKVRRKRRGAAKVQRKTKRGRGGAR